MPTDHLIYRPENTLLICVIIYESSELLEHLFVFTEIKFLIVFVSQGLEFGRKIDQ